MLRFIASRLFATLPVLFVVALIVFLILRLAPGDPAAVIAGNNATSEDIARIHTALGLDHSLPVQFFIWFRGLLQGDLGYSFFMNKPVASLIAQRLEPTMSLAIGSMLLAVLVAVPLGTLAARHIGGWLDKMLMTFCVGGFSVPVFVISYGLIYLLGLQLRWLPVQGYAHLSSGIAEWSQRLVIPWMSLMVVYVALLSRVTRTAVSEAMTEDYVTTARAKGLSEVRIVFRHALANASIPIVTVIGIGFALLIGGVVVTETVFSIPGLGSLTVDAVLQRDFPVIQGVVLFFSVCYVLLNLLVDLSYLLLDPRIRY